MHMEAFLEVGQMGKQGKSNGSMPQPNEPVAKLV